MTRFPALALAQRSLAIDSRRRSPYVTRTVLASLMLLSTLMASEHARWFGAPGQHLLSALVHVNFWFTCLFGTSAFASVITEEKEGETLEVLRLAGLGGGAVLLGKSAGLLATALLLVAVQLPFAMLAVTLGGVTPHQVLAAWLVLLAHLVFVYSLALLSSVLMPRTGLAQRLTVLLLLGYYALPPLLHAGFGGNTAVAGASQRMMATTAWAGLDGALNDPAVPLWSEPVLGTMGIAGCAFLLAWLWFAPGTRAPGEAAGGRRWVSALPRPRGNPVFWKDFHFLAGGWPGLGLRTAVYFALVLALPVAVPGRDPGVFLIVLMLLDLALHASRMFGEEIQARTLPMLMVLPVSMHRWAYAKARACACLALPPLLVCGTVTLLAPDRSRVLAQLLMPDGVLVAAMVVLALHMAVWLSTHNGRAKIVKALLLLLALQMSTVMGLVGDSAVPLLFVTFYIGLGGSLFLQGAIEGNLRERAGE